LTHLGGDPVPLPLKGCKIFAGEGVKEFAVHIPLPGVTPYEVKQIDLAAQVRGRHRSLIIAHMSIYGNNH
jgi:hypothetical protein